MTDMSEGPNVSDERQHAEAVAREWISHNGLDAHSTSDQKHRDISSLADLIMAERAGLLARAEAAEAETKRCANGWDAAGREAKGLKLRAEAERSLREQFSDDAYDLRAKLAASEARVAHLESLVSEGQEVTHNSRTFQKARAERAEAAAGQMRSALDLYLSSQDDETWRHHGCPSTPSIIAASRAALATDAGRDYQSPEQVARACAAARDATLEEAAQVCVRLLGAATYTASTIRALKVTP